MPPVRLVLSIGGILPPQQYSNAYRGISARKQAVKLAVMGNYSDAEHIRQFVLDGAVTPFPPGISRLASVHLENLFPLRLATSIVNWDAIENTSLEWSTATDDEAVNWSASTLAGQCNFGLLLYSPSEPCLVGKFKFMIRHLDELVWKSPGCRLLFGVDVLADEEIRFTSGLIEFDGKSTLYGAI